MVFSSLFFQIEKTKKYFKFSKLFVWKCFKSSFHECFMIVMCGKNTILSRFEIKYHSIWELSVKKLTGWKLNEKYLEVIHNLYFYGIQIWCISWLNMWFYYSFICTNLDGKSFYSYGINVAQLRMWHLLY